MDKPASASFAAVVLENYSPAQIKQATLTVFAQNGYSFAGEQGDALVFEREATRGETIDYAGFAGAHDGAKVIMQVRVKIEVKDASSYWLTCKTYAVSNPGQQVFENSTPLFNFQSKPYQKLLNMVKGTLQTPAVAP